MKLKLSTVAFGSAATALSYGSAYLISIDSWAAFPMLIQCITVAVLTFVDAVGGLEKL